MQPISQDRLIAQLREEVRSLTETTHELRASETRWRAIFDANPQPMWIYDADSLRFLAVNDAAIAHYGYSRAEFEAMTIADIRLPQDVPRLRDHLRATTRGRLGESGTWRHRRRDGSVIEVEITRSTCEHDGRTDRIVLAHDVTARVRSARKLASVSRLHAMLSRTNDLVARAGSRTALFEGVCRVAVEAGGFRFAWVGMLGDDARVAPVARAGDDAGYIDAVCASADACDPRGQGPIGRALRSGTHEVNNAFVDDESTRAWHDAARRVGVGSLVALPLHESDRVVGTINLYACEAGFFDAPELATLDRVAVNVSFGLETLARAEERLRLHAELEATEARWRSALEGAGHGVWEWNMQTGQVFYSARWKEMLGYGDRDIGDSRSEWESRVHPDDLAAVHAGLRCHLAGETVQVCCEHRLRAKSGDYRWTLVQGRLTSRTPQGKPLLMIGTLSDITDRIRADAHAKELGDRLRRYLLLSPSVTYALRARDERLIVEWMSSNVERLMGWTVAQALAPGWWHDNVHPMDRDATAGLAERLMRDGAATCEYRFRCADGRWIWIGDQLRVDRSTDGTPARIVGAWADVTHQHEIRQRLKASERRFRAAFDQASVGMTHTTPDGRWLRVNRRFASMLGYTPREMVGRMARDFTHPGDFERDLALIHEVIEGAQRSYSSEKRYLRKAGGFVSTGVSTTLVRTHEGTPEYFAAVVVDLTDRKRAMDELRRLSQAIEQSSEAIVITDAGGTIEYVNEAFVNISGYARDEVLGRNPRMLQSGDTPRSTYERMWAELSAGLPWRGEFHNRAKDGRGYVESVTVSPIRESGGRITHYVAVKEDVTGKLAIAKELERYRLSLEDMVEKRTAQLDEARRQAAAANEAKSAFLANMSHEIRTPMNGVLGMLEVLEQGALSEPQLEMVRAARDSGRTLLGIIDDILDFSKIEAGLMRIERTAVCIADLVESLCESLATAATGKQVDLSVFIAPGIPERVLADPLRLRQILFNLIGNALKFSGAGADSGKRVAVRVSVAQHSPLRLAFAVIDRGIGIAPEHLKRLFAPFTQAEISTTRRYGGTGLGLSVCKRLADLMGARIDVHSRLGSGSTFTLTMPVDVPVEQPHRERRDLTGFDCIVCEQGDFDVDGICAYLGHAGARVHRVADAREGERCALTLGAPVVAIHHADAMPFADTPLRPPAPHVALLLLARGRRRVPRPATPRSLAIDATALRRDALLHAVASAAGCVAPERASDRSGLRPLPQPPASTHAGPILVAEDDTLNRKVLRLQLELLGHSPTIVGNGIEALRAWREHRWALLLTDLHMPEMDGWELTATIRREEQEQRRGSTRTPIVALTANALRDQAESAAARGFDGYLTKPLDLDKLRDALTRWLVPSQGASAVARNDIVLDLEVVKRTIGDEPHRVQTLLSTFLRTVRQQARDIRKAMLAGDAAEVGKAAHKLKPAARAVGALALGDLCEAIETSARTRDLDALRPQLAGFEREFTRVEAAIGAALEPAAQSDPGRRIADGR